MREQHRRDEYLKWYDCQIEPVVSLEGALKCVETTYGGLGIETRQGEIVKFYFWRHMREQGYLSIG